MENIITAIILFIGASGLYWLYIKVDKDGGQVTKQNTPEPFYSYGQEEDIFLYNGGSENPYLKSIKELDIMLDEDLREETINKAFLVCINRYVLYLESNQVPAFTISQKEAARDYLIHFLKKRKVTG